LKKIRDSAFELAGDVINLWRACTPAVSHSAGIQENENIPRHPCVARYRKQPTQQLAGKLILRSPSFVKWGLLGSLALAFHDQIIVLSISDVVLPLSL
jgi:hypothetical protein